ncbi:MAG: Mu-like prophage major head subunit gpT family protein, partial [Armatimonadetes bacterium]|nr:Mu-like prophage major head subunit gpT family protein [Armatimonadota bacterium]
KSDVPNLLEDGLRTVFFEALDATVGDYERIATIVTSESDEEVYPWLGAVPRVREFTDERMPLGLLEHSYTIKNKTWESSIAVERSAIEDDKYGQIKLRVQSLAREVKRHMDELVFTLLKNGFTTTCYDGQYFFETDHSEGESGTQSNKGSSALDATALQAAITAMMKFKDDRGKLLGVVPDILVVPPDLQWTAMELLESTYWPEEEVSNTKLASNVLRGKLDLIVSPYLTDPNDWFVLSTKGVVKPVLLQLRTPVEFAALEADSESGFMRDQYIYGVRARYNVGYGLWQMAYGSRVS